MAMLQPFGSRIKVMWSGGLNLDGGPVDLLLIGESFLPLEGNDVLGNALANPDAAAVVIITWDTRIASRQRALSMGCRGYLHNGLEAERVVSALERVMEGETMVSPAAVEASGANISFNGGRWPGDDHGLSRREAEIIGLITNGFSNDEIAQMLYLSINTIKSYVRSGYRKIGAERRPHAVRWGIEHGMLTL